MLDLDTERRITATEALAHRYLRQYSDPQDEPTAAHYDQSFENLELPIPDWKSKYFLPSLYLSLSIINAIITVRK